MRRGQSRREKDRGRSRRGRIKRGELEGWKQRGRSFEVVLTSKFVITNFQHRNYELTHNYQCS
jgi:hypothetical protein